MADFDLVIRGRRVITRAGEVPRCIAVRDGVVVAIEPLESRLEGAETVDLADDEVLLPGLVDSHVHVNEPGRTEWEGFATATRAAAAGGVTTILDMPLNSIPPTTTVDGLEVKRKAAQDSAHVDVGFWGGAIPGNIDDLRGLHDAGVFGFKCFMTDSGVEEFPPLSAEQLEEYLGVLASYGAKMIVHAEDSTAIERAPAPHGRALRRLPRLAAARLGERGDRAPDRGGPAHRGVGAPAAPVQLRRRADAAHRAPRGHPDDRRDLPALPGVRGRGDRRRGHAVQVLPADPGDRQPRGAVARAGARRHRLRRVRPLPVHRPSSSGSTWASSTRRGAASRRCRSGCLPCGPRPGCAATRSSTSSGGCRSGPPRSPGCSTRAASSAATTPTSPCSRRTPRSSSTRTLLHHRNPVTPYAQRALAGVVRSTWLRGRRVTGDEPRGTLISRGEA